jgi:hypothetical protein
MRHTPLFLVALLLALTAFRTRAGEAWEAITDDEINKMTFEDVEEDMGFVCPWAPDLEHLDDDRKKRLDEWVDDLNRWEPGLVDDVGQRVKNFCCLMGLMDIVHGEWEGEAPIKVYEKLVREIPKEKLKKACAWVVLKPESGETIGTMHELGLEADVDPEFARERAVWYAKKVLGRVLNKLPIRYDEKGNRIEPGQAAAAPAPADAPATATPSNPVATPTAQAPEKPATTK